MAPTAATQSQTETPTTAPPDTTLPPDAEEIMDRALAEEAPPEIPGVRKISADEIRFQRRMSVIFTVLPLLGVVAAMFLLWGRGISGLDLGLFLGFYVFTGLGITVGYHRLFTHRSFEVPRPVRFVIALAGSMAVQGNLIEWVSTHRRHHAYADEYGDPHSPHLVEETGLKGVLRGLWHAHVGWMTRPEDSVPSRWAPDLEDELMLVRMSAAFGWLTLATFLLPPVIAFAVTGSWFAAFTGFVWGSLVRVFLLHHVTWSINSICHFFGQQPFESRDESTNNRWLSVLSFGESWHNNHHAFPTSARHGLLRWQPDPSWRVIRTLEQLRLAHNVRLPSPSHIAKKWRDGVKALASPPAGRN
ncbi:MAG: acyl-CoA desaturase [Nitriliruptorales bacterium]|nr:acyl-CoA desaturase [Nitriliruptorales bacterium]